MLNFNISKVVHWTRTNNLVPALGGKMRDPGNEVGEQTVRWQTVQYNLPSKLVDDKNKTEEFLKPITIEEIVFFRINIDIV